MFRKLITTALLVPLAACASAGGLGFLGSGYPASGGTRHVQYDVRGDTFDEIRRDLSSKGRHGFHGWTEWQVRWEYEVSGIPGRACDVAAFRTILAVRITTPRLVDADAKPHALRAEWQRYEHALRRHEEGHAVIAEEAAREMERRVGRLRATAAGCRVLGARIDDVCRQVLAEYRRLDAEYERETGHGRTQGALFGLDRSFEFNR